MQSPEVLVDLSFGAQLLGGGQSNPNEALDPDFFLQGSQRFFVVGRTVFF